MINIFGQTVLFRSSISLPLFHRTCLCSVILYGRTSLLASSAGYSLLIDKAAYWHYDIVYVNLHVILANKHLSLQGACGIIFPIIKAEGVRQMFFPATVPAYYRAPPEAEL